MQPTESENALIRSLEQQSFLDYCMRIGRDPDAHAGELLAEKKRFIHALCESLAPNLRIVAATTAHALLSAPDFFAYMRIAGADEIEQCNRDIVHAMNELPISWGYVERLSRQLNFQLKSKDPQSISQLLRATPFVITYDMEFDAYAESGGLIGDRPYVKLCHKVVTVAEAFFDVVFGKAIAVLPSGQLMPTGPDSWDHVGSEFRFSNALRSIIDCGLGLADEMRIDPSLRISHVSPHFRLELSLSAMRRFVILHEYGHIFMGHVGSQPTKDYEFEADKFADIAICARFNNIKNSKTWLRLGEMAMLVLLQIISEVHQVGIHEVHPSPLLRADKLAGIDLVDSPVMVGMTTAMLGVCRHTLDRYYT